MTELRMFGAVALISLGVVVTLVAALGLFRLKDALDRLHAGALVDTLGLLLILGGLMLLCGLTVHTAKLALALVILWATNPVSAHLIARMELFTGYDIDPDHYEGEEKEL